MTEDEVKNAIERFDNFLQENGKTTFTEQEAFVLKEFAKIMLGFRAMGTLGAFLYRIVFFIMFFIGVYVSMKAGVIDWLKDVLK